MTANLGPASLVWQQPMLLRFLIHPMTLPEPMRSANASPRSVRQECLDHQLLLHEKQLQCVLNEYVAYFNQTRPHQGIRQQLPEPPRGPLSPDHDRGKVSSFAVLGGLHHDYRSSVKFGKHAERWPGEALVNLQLVSSGTPLIDEHVRRGQESCFTCELLYRCLLLASTKKLFFATSTVRIASLVEKRDQNEHICYGKRSIFSNGWAK